MLTMIFVCWLYCAVSIISPGRKEYNVELPSPGLYATGILFMDRDTAEHSEGHFKQLADDLNIQVGLVQFQLAFQRAGFYNLGAR